MSNGLRVKILLHGENKKKNIWGITGQYLNLGETVVSIEKRKREREEGADYGFSRESN